MAIPKHFAEAAAAVQTQVAQLKGKLAEYDAAIAKVKLSLAPMEETRGKIARRIENLEHSIALMQGLAEPKKPGLMDRLLRRKAKAEPLPADPADIPLPGEVIPAKTFVEVHLSENERKGLSPRELALANRAAEVRED